MSWLERIISKTGMGKSHLSQAIGHHIFQVTTTGTKLLHHAALVLFFHIDGDRLVGFMSLSINLSINDLGSRHTQLVAFTSHGFDQDRQV